jgi:hypothetical protein
LSLALIHRVLNEKYDDDKNDKLELKTGITHFKVMFQNLSGGTKENIKNSQES